MIFLHLGWSGSVEIHMVNTTSGASAGECGDGAENGLHEFDSDTDYAVGCSVFNECNTG